MNWSVRIRLLNEYVNLTRSYWRDFRRYCRHACVGWNRVVLDPGQLEGRIMATYHVVEKGLSMPDFRPRFGVPVVKSLIRLLREGECHCEWRDNVNFETGRSVVRAYMEKHQAMEIDLSNDFTADEIAYGREEKVREDLVAGALSHNRETYFEKANSSFLELARSRHSCRVFQPDQPAELDKIRRAVSAARYAPSVCNRQCWRLHVFEDKEKVEELLAFQGGNRGFGHTIPTVLVVTASLKVFESYKEKSQGFIDGGLFSMSLMYALHHEELGCVPLCWLVPMKKDEEFRKVAGIPDDEIILMLMGVGTPVEQFAAPASQRRDIDEVLKVH